MLRALDLGGPGRTQASGCRVDGKVARGTRRLQHTNTRALVPTPTQTPTRQRGQQGRAACSMSTRPYMRLESLSAGNRAGSSDSPLGG